MNYRTAVHEAGHAVIGRVLGFPCGRATIVPDPDKGTEGCAQVDTSLETWFNCESTRSEFVLHRASIIVSLAAEEAEMDVLGSASDGYDADNESVMLCAMEMSDVALDPDQRVMQRLRRQTARLVRKHRDKIERVAAALMERRTLSGGEIDELMHQSGPPLTARSLAR